MSLSSRVTDPRPPRCNPPAYLCPCGQYLTRRDSAASVDSPPCDVLIVEDVCAQYAGQFTNGMQKNGMSGPYPYPPSPPYPPYPPYPRYPPSPRYPPPSPWYPPYPPPPRSTW